jgi:single-strand DNA-binding protein
MAKGLNKVMLIGRLGKDPEMSYTGSGVAYCKFSVATDNSYKDESGNWIDRTDWHNIVAWRKLAEICSQYLKKGSKVYLEGKLQTDTVEKDGKKSYFTKVVLNEMVMLDSKGSGNGEQDSSRSNESVSEPVTENKSDDDLPF